MVHCDTCKKKQKQQLDKYRYNNSQIPAQAGSYISSFSSGAVGPRHPPRKNKRKEEEEVDRRHQYVYAPSSSSSCKYACHCCTSDSDSSDCEDECVGATGATGPMGLNGATGATGPLGNVVINNSLIFNLAGRFTMPWPDPTVQVVFLTIVGGGGGGGGAALVDQFGAAGGGGGGSGSAIIRYPLFNDGTNPSLSGVVGGGGLGGLASQSISDPVDATSGQDGEVTSITLPTDVHLIAYGGGGAAGASIHPEASPPFAAAGQGGAGFRPAWRPDDFDPVPIIGTGVLSPFGDLGGEGAYVTPFTQKASQKGHCGPFAPIVSGLSTGLPSTLPSLYQSFGKASSSGGGGGANIFVINQIQPASVGGPAAMPFVGYPYVIDPVQPGELAQGGGGALMLTTPLIPPLAGNGGHGGQVNPGGAFNGQNGEVGIAIFEW